MTALDMFELGFVVVVAIVGLVGFIKAATSDD